jgi:eukaryotic-like serine/threonine-protein kinase
MTPERWQRAKEIFQVAVDRAPDERSAFLASACDGDEALRKEVESLIASHEKSGEFIDSPAYEAATELFKADQDLKPGQGVGHYEILSTLGRGGMGEVYLARDSKLGRKLALKFLPYEFTKDAERLRRFEQEARAASALNHPNILTIHEIGAENGHHFIATEFIDGESLREHIRDKRLELHEALEIAIQVASALSAAHAARIVHRDIKPENIMVRKDGIVKVLDFGLAKLAEPKQKAKPDMEAPTEVLHLTAPGVVMGTASHMSPEQARGLEVDERTDIWSLGVVLYEMVTARLPFAGGTTSDVIAHILQREPLSVLLYGSEMPAEVERIVEKALTKRREERYQSAKELGLDLKRLKQRLEIDAELSRSMRPEEEARPAAMSSQAVSTSSNQTNVVAPIATAGGEIHPTSSAQYIVEGIKRHKRGAALGLATFVVAIAALASLAYFFFVRSKPSINSVAVMPFVNVSKDPNTEYLSDGISESLTNDLSQLPQLKVIASSSTDRYKGKEFDPEEVAKALGVGAIVTGRVIQRGDELQISVALVNALDKTLMWGAQYNRRATDLQAVQSEIARTVSEKLRLRLTGAQEQQLATQATQNPQAYQLFLNGVFYYRKGNIEDHRKALDYYNQAVALDPKFAGAYAGMAYSYFHLMASGANPAELQPKARAAAQKAVELDDSLAEAHSALGFLKRDEWDWPGAESEYKRAFELNPNLATAHNSYAIYLSQMGRTAEALAENKRGQELDPLRIAAKYNEARILYYARRYDEAIQAFQNVIKMQPDFAGAHGGLGAAYAAKGQYAEAIAAFQKRISLDGETPLMLCALGNAYAKSGKRDEALTILNKLKTTKEHVSPYDLAILYVGLDDKEAALESLDRAYQTHHFRMQYLKVDSALDALRSEARFQDLMRRLGLPQ